ncbi:APC family permease [Roseibium suaedae]|uniref:Amino acid permease n=1 Tax=Roseibium suaedae TaxID=735517 RepID=A0A1M6ZSB5_9HYPH|nr:hypothetical protein [Roseibium suaedae]SHL33362.1 hypothetical protein SAMN05444272_0328 [Roseibium suaedae]
MILDGLILLVVVLAGSVLLAPRLRTSQEWRAVITPLASIIGSGFLVLGPILARNYGVFAPAMMAVLCAAAWLFGSAIRFNIRAIEDKVAQGRWGAGIETAASWSLAFAYFISVAYYLNLFGSFGVNLIPGTETFHAKLLTTAVFVVILLVGWFRGFQSLERLEYGSVAIKLAIIAGLFVGLAAFFAGHVLEKDLIFEAPHVSGWNALFLAFGLLITVQGFETSRYLGGEYSADTRIRSMRQAQIISTGIYLVYMLLIAFVFPRSELGTSETAIIDMMELVTPILPVLLVGAALAAQFSAAIADTAGSGGLIEEESGRRVSSRHGYLLLSLTGIGLTWVADVFDIINYASRAFALYYMLQAALAVSYARARGTGGWHVGLFGCLAVLGGLIALFGQAVEGG